MGAAVGLIGGIGLFFVWLACTVPRTAEGVRRPSRLAVLLARAGLTRHRPRDLIALSLVLALVVFAGMQLLTGTPPIAVVFAVIAGWLPVAWVAGRSRRRLREFARVWPEVVDNLASGGRAGLSGWQRVAVCAATPRALLVCRWPMTDHCTPRSARFCAFRVASCTLFSPSCVQPASTASRMRSSGTVLLTGSRRTSCGSRPARCAAASIRRCTCARRSRNSSTVVAGA